MPIIEPLGARVLVTGSNGYIGLWIVQVLLEQGFSVRAVVRSLEKGKDLKNNFASYGDKLELFVVENMQKDGAYDEAVKDVHAVVHTATTSTFNPVEPDEYIKPAVEGTVGILESARKFGNAIRRIVVTSSIAAVGFTQEGPTVTFDESNWNDAAVEFVKAKGKDASPVIKYCASKNLAERAAWEFYEKNKKEIKWDLVTILPSSVLGPPLQAVSSPDTLNLSLWMFWDAIANEKSDEELKSTVNYVHVKDIAFAHVAALRKEKAGGERIIVSDGASTWQGIRNFIHSLRPDLYAKGILPRGNVKLDTAVACIHSSENSKKILGLEYATEGKVVGETLAYFEEKGWLQSPSKYKVSVLAQQGTV